MQNIFHIQVVEGSKETKVVQIRTEDGTFSEIQLCGLILSIHFPNGQTKFGGILSYHAIETGLFLWEYKKIRPHLIDNPYNKINRWTSRDFLGISNGLIVTFYLPNFYLWVKDSDERYLTFEEAYENSIIPVLTKNAERIEKGIYSEEYRKVRLSQYIDYGFFSPFASQACVGKITEVTRQNGLWEIKIMGTAPYPRHLKKHLDPQPYDPNASDNRKATFILSDDYEVLEVREEPINSD